MIEVPQAAIDLAKRFEGFCRVPKSDPDRAYPYVCPAGFWTIGYGHLCDAKHLPGYVQHADALKAKGVDTIACMAVNDMFVMGAWGKASNVGDKVMMLADGNGDYTKALGLELDARGFGMGVRGKRFAIIVKDGVATHVNVEAGGEFKVSAAEYVLGQL